MPASTSPEPAWAVHAGPATATLGRSPDGPHTYCVAPFEQHGRSWCRAAACSDRADRVGLHLVAVDVQQPGQLAGVRVEQHPLPQGRAPSAGAARVRVEHQRHVLVERPLQPRAAPTSGPVAPAAAEHPAPWTRPATDTTFGRRGPASPPLGPAEPHHAGAGAPRPEWRAPPPRGRRSSPCRGLRRRGSTCRWRRPGPAAATSAGSQRRSGSGRSRPMSTSSTRPQAEAAG